MDLRFGDSKPTDEEREAVDALLGPPESAWEGADDRSPADLRWARGGREARERRDLLLPGLHALNDRVGWISEGGLNYLCRRLTVPPAEAYGVATFYSMFAVRPRPAQLLHVCTDLACAARGAGALTSGLTARGVTFAPSPCLGLCERAPAALLTRAGVEPAQDGSQPLAREPEHGDSSARDGRTADPAPSGGRTADPPTADGVGSADSVARVGRTADPAPSGGQTADPPTAGPTADGVGSGDSAARVGGVAVGVPGAGAGPRRSLLGALSGEAPTAPHTVNSVAPGGTTRGDGPAAHPVTPGGPAAAEGSSGPATPGAPVTAAGPAAPGASAAPPLAPGAPRTRLAAVIAPATAAELAYAVRDPEAAAPEVAAVMAVPQAGQAGLPLLARVGVVDPGSVDDYRAHGGYAALRRAFALGPAGVIREVTESGLVGRGGAAFPTGRKWQATASQPDAPHYVVCNADESEPGTFKDRVLMEGDPYALVEAMTVAGYAVGADRGYLYIRGEYPRAHERLAHAIDEARARGLLGDDVLGSGFAFDIEIRRGAGAYICGEETALFNSIEGYRGEPRSKPPFPVEKGLFGKPTAANNVETLVNVLPILTRGAEAFRATETKLFCVSGNVDRPGVYELPFGITLGELLDLAGRPDTLRAVLLGGAAGGFVRPDELDIPLTFEGTRAAGTTLGSGVVLVLDGSVDLPRILLRIAEFFRDESCGQCVPCRVGTVRQEEALHRVKDRTGAAAADDIALLREVGQALRDASICGLGQTAWNAVESAIDRLGVYT
ncbi:NADH-ubiquinone oxidoreductase-F iron-sulfur binding region domain-containing protein [Streptomyces sp. NPDC003035]|uniref:NADH-ubiquinone oxidoreductase-F iron-sulfur binding region domain-containing protein n=1 Tax=Streptomyces sp. NPDC003035 TaxID=3364676 RepID=UPI0036CCD507